MTIEEQIKRRLNPEEFCDILEISIEELWDAFAYKVVEAQVQGRFYFLEEDSDDDQD